MANPRKPRRAKRAKKLIITLVALLLAAIAFLAALFFIAHRYMPVMPDLPQVEAPAGSQLLTFPMDNAIITTGYRNPVYLQRFGFPHFGLDLVPISGGHAYILSSGEGVVLGTEFRDNSLGYIAVIRYDDVFIPQTGDIMPLIARYYHMASLYVNAGDVLSGGQVIGSVDGRHELYSHIHIEFDANINFPFHTPQVAEASSNLLYRSGATGELMINPLYVLVVGTGQWVFLHPNATYATQNDHPRFMQEREQPRWLDLFA